jgi:hypothetical protein
MIRSTEAVLLFSGWKVDGSTVRAFLMDSDEITRCTIEGRISKVENALLEIKNAREGMLVNLAGAEFDYGDSRDFGSREDVYSDLIRARLLSGLHFAVAVLKAA